MDQTEYIDFTRVSKYLNKPKIIMGMTQDECIPAFIMIFMGVSANALLLSLVVSAVWVFGLKTLKRYRSPEFLRIWVYWFCGRQLSGLVFPMSPDATKRFWLR